MHVGLLFSEKSKIFICLLISNFLFLSGLNFKQGLSHRLFASVFCLLLGKKIYIWNYPCFYFIFMHVQQTKLIPLINQIWKEPRKQKLIIILLSSPNFLQHFYQFVRGCNQGWHILKIYVQMTGFLYPSHFYLFIN